MNTVALELVPPDVDKPASTRASIRAEAHRIRKSGIGGQLGHIMIPGMIAEDDDRPLEMKPKLDVLDYWLQISPELPGVQGLCTQVTAFMDEPALRERLTCLRTAGFDGVIFVGVPRTMSDGQGAGVAPADALSTFSGVLDNRGVILIPTRAAEHDRFEFKCAKGATFAMTQLLYSDAIVEFLSAFARTTEHRPEILLSFGFVPKIEQRAGLIDWLIRDQDNEKAAEEQDFVRRLAAADPATKRRALIDLYRRVIDGVGGLGYPLSVHFEAPYGVSDPALDTFAEMLDYWSPSRASGSTTDHYSRLV